MFENSVFPLPLGCIGHFFNNTHFYGIAGHHRSPPFNPWEILGHGMRVLLLPFPRMLPQWPMAASMMVFMIPTPYLALSICIRRHDANFVLEAVCDSDVGHHQ